MYCAIGEDDEIIAYHENKDIVKDYILNAEKSSTDNNIELRLLKVKNKKFYRIRGLDDLYLVRYGSTYIQSGYLIYLQLVSNNVAEDNQYVKDMLFRMIEIYQLSDKDVKTLMRAIKVIDKIISNEDSYTPSMSELKKYKSIYDEYINYNKFQQGE